MTPADLPQGLALGTDAGWNQTIDDWRLSLALGAGHAFAAESDGAVAGTVIGARFGDAVWIGMMLVRASARRRGIGRALMRTVLDACAGIPRIGLDATPAGEPLYATLGFRGVATLERRVRPPGPMGPSLDGRVTRLRDDRRASRLDAQVTGMDRSALIRALLARADVDAFALERHGTLSGFCLVRPGCRYRYVGPLVARDEADGRALLQAVADTHPTEPLALDVAVRQRAWIAGLDALGFRTTRTLRRMTTSSPTATDASAVTTIAGPEWG